jgi:hypothetical protein
MRQNGPMEAWRVRRAANWANGSTLLGCAVARLAGAQVGAGPRGLLVATGYRLPLPRASAFTLGDVVTTRHDRAWLDARPALLRHEERHTWQYAACLGLPMLPLYAVAAGWSYLVSGDPARHNVFERTAGLADGGYLPSA